MNFSMEDNAPAFVIGHHNAKAAPGLSARSVDIAHNSGVRGLPSQGHPLC